MSLRKEAIELGGTGTRSLQNKVTRTAKHKNDRQVHKRRRQKNKKEIMKELS